MENLLPGDVISDFIAFTGLYEPAMTRRVSRLARRGGLMVDVGANLGYFSLVWAAASTHNRVVAFEAAPRNLEALRRNELLNGMESQIQIYGAAAGKERRTLPFTLGDDTQTGWGGFAPTAESHTIEVDVVRIDEALNPSDEIALLKIDIEGADTWALIGCERLLRSHRIKEVWFEQNKPRMRELGIAEDAAEQFLRSCGYRLYAQSNRASELVEWSAVPIDGST